MTYKNPWPKMTCVPVDPVTTADKLAFVEGVLYARRRVRYDFWIEKGLMTPFRAAHEIACMESIIEDLRAAAERERLL